MYSNDVIDRAYELRRLIRDFIHRFGLMQQHETPCGQPMSVARAHALMVLHETDEGARVSDLGEQLNIDLSNVSRLCDRLEADGLIERRKDPNDGRVRRLHLTRDGRVHAARVDAASLNRFASVLEQMPDRSHGQVIETLELLNTAIENYENS
jgi:DNA-binding MarR family transcriptional regulator